MPWLPFFFANLLLCKSSSLQVFFFASLLLCKSSSLQVFFFASLLVRKSSCSQVFLFASLLVRKSSPRRRVIQPPLTLAMYRPLCADDGWNG
jgi:hypothetical protein